MIKKGILNPTLLSLLARVRHTNTLVISDRGFPYWPQVETVDLSLVDGVPTVLQVLKAVLENGTYGQAYMAEEFKAANDSATLRQVKTTLGKVPLTFEPHEAVFKKRVLQAIGLIRTGDTIQYANMILVSA